MVLKKQVAILRIERAMVRAMCGVKLMDKKTTDELMDKLGLNETSDKWQRQMECDGKDMCCGEKMMMF